MNVDNIFSFCKKVDREREIEKQMRMVIEKTTEIAVKREDYIDNRLTE